MTPVFSVDVSESQDMAVDDTYNLEWFSFRLCFNGTIDGHARKNLQWARKARADGRILGFTGYMVPLPGGNDGCMASLEELDFPDDMPVMVDGEKWGGADYEIFGDHSDQFNKLAARVRDRQGGRSDLAWAYGNRGPDLIVWPHKADWLGWVVASYGGDKPDESSMIGWQYTDGQKKYDRPDFPHKTPPFGRCDHNAFYKLPEVDMPLTQDDKDWIKSAVADGRTALLNDVHHELVNVFRAVLTGIDSGPYTHEAFTRWVDEPGLRDALLKVVAQTDLTKVADAVSKAVVAALPPQPAGLTADDVQAATEKAIRQVFPNAGAPGAPGVPKP